MGRELYITETDLNRLTELVHTGPGSRKKDDKSRLTLEQTLDHAQVVEPTAVPETVVTMNSTARVLDMATGQERVCTVVFPKDANLEENRISVLAPLGTAMLGCQVGDVIEWRPPGGAREVRILEMLYQPEAAGHYHG
ncbi:MAG TPA: nucleoside diphosphate kinase regulator [Nitrospiraceae bacterium]|nr:nucleoside diphosphate kinase regulator [Nitrospiraceae bacterium]